MKLLISVMIATTPAALAAEAFQYEYFIHHSIKYAETQLDIPDHCAMGESEIETDEQRYAFWSGWWHALKYLEFNALRCCD
jgi:hypothetical protein